MLTLFPLVPPTGVLVPLPLPPSPRARGTAGWHGPRAAAASTASTPDSATASGVNAPVVIVFTAADRNAPDGCDSVDEQMARSRAAIAAAGLQFAIRNVPPTSARQEILACVGQFAATALSTAPDDVRTKELARAVAFEMCHTLGHVDDGTGRIGSRMSDPSAATLLEWAGDLRQPSQMNAFKDYVLNQPPAVLMICAMSP